MEFEYKLSLFIELPKGAIHLWISELQKKMGRILDTSRCFARLETLCLLHEGIILICGDETEFVAIHLTVSQKVAVAPQEAVNCMHGVFSIHILSKRVDAYEVLIVKPKDCDEGAIYPSSEHLPGLSPKQSIRCYGIRLTG